MKLWWRAGHGGASGRKARARARRTPGGCDQDDRKAQVRAGTALHALLKNTICLLLRISKPNLAPVWGQIKLDAHAVAKLIMSEPLDRGGVTSLWSSVVFHAQVWRRGRRLQWWTLVWGVPRLWLGCNCYEQKSNDLFKISEKYAL